MVGAVSRSRGWSRLTSNRLVSERDCGLYLTMPRCITTSLTSLKTRRNRILRFTIISWLFGKYVSLFYTVYKIVRYMLDQKVYSGRHIDFEIIDIIEVIKNPLFYKRFNKINLIELLQCVNLTFHQDIITGLYLL